MKQQVNVLIAWESRMSFSTLVLVCYVLCLWAMVDAGADAKLHVNAYLLVYIYTYIYIFYEEYIAVYFVSVTVSLLFIQLMSCELFCLFMTVGKTYLYQRQTKCCYAQNKLLQKRYVQMLFTRQRRLIIIL